MSKQLIARWQDWSGAGLEHLVLKQEPDAIVAESVVLATVDGEQMAVSYRIHCDSNWRVRRAEIVRISEDRSIKLVSDGAGNWSDESGTGLPDFRGAIDIDIQLTPFTNTLPIRRLHLKPGQSAEIIVVYIQFPGLNAITDRQRYTCLDTHRYRYDSVDSDFTREIEVDDHGLVVMYPGLFRRVL